MTRVEVIRHMKYSYSVVDEKNVTGRYVSNHRVCVRGVSNLSHIREIFPLHDDSFGGNVGFRIQNLEHGGKPRTDSKQRGFFTPITTHRRTHLCPRLTPKECELDRVRVLNLRCTSIFKSITASAYKAIHGAKAMRHAHQGRKPSNILSFPTLAIKSNRQGMLDSCRTEAKTYSNNITPLPSHSNAVNSCAEIAEHLLHRLAAFVDISAEMVLDSIWRVKQ